MKFVILTGMSGAGKSTALKMMEDIGFYCVDNLPIPLLEKFVELSDLQQNAELQKVAVRDRHPKVDKHLRNSEVCLTGNQGKRRRL